MAYSGNAGVAREEKAKNNGNMTQGRLPDIWDAARRDAVDEVRRILNTHPEMLNMPQEETLLTPLHYAAVNDSKQVSQFLLSQSQLDGWATDKLGRAPLALAYCTGDEELISLFKRRLLPEHMRQSPVRLIDAHNKISDDPSDVSPT